MINFVLTGRGAGGISLGLQGISVLWDCLVIEKKKFLFNTINEIKYNKFTLIQ